jgi:hypothetical protein
MMNKVVAFLEKHVQWIALGLGGLYLGYMIWTYALQTPVVATGIGPTPLTPGEVDPLIDQTVALPLDAAMKDTNVPDFTVPNFIEQFKADMDFSNFTPYVLDWHVNSPVLRYQLSSPAQNPANQTLAINKLPDVPPIAVVDHSSGRSNVLPLTAVAGAAPPANGAQAVAGSSDKCWVTVSYKISPSDLAKAFRAVNIPPWTNHTTILQVQLTRQEMLPGGKWSDPRIITPINIAALQPLPTPGNVPDEQAFLTWAIAHVGDILQPGFYQVVKGDQWHAPGQILAPVVPVALAPLDPNQSYTQEQLSQYPADQKHAYFLAHNKLKASQPRPSGRSAPPGPPPGFSPGAPGAGAQNRPNSLLGRTGMEIDADVIPGPGGPGALPPDYGAPPGAMQPGMMPPSAAPVATPPDLAAQFPIPSGDFDPNTVKTDITGWAHDDTAEPGHTYRYSITYSIKNPIFGAAAAKINPALAGVFAIQSPPGPWSAPFNVASTTNFFVFANSQPGSQSARFKVYKWQNGLERSKVFEVAPGDIIGGKDGDVDFSTGWTVVDLRFDDPHNPDSMTILVMDPNGVLGRRDYRTDQGNNDRKALEQQVTAAGPADQLAKQP